jgi:bifunctional non-homologous end joining protein LigD
VAPGSRDARDRRLRSYRAKRDFSASGEPRGATRAAAKQLRFVIQEHSARRLHWDLRLEHDGVLVSWALPKGLPEAPKDNRFAAFTEDHPLEYLDFHGQIPKGEYGAGSMTIWDRGTFELLKWEPRKVEVALRGERVQGRYALFAIGEGEQPKDWMIHRMDAPADPAREPMPERVRPMLATPGTLPRDDRGWAYEIKWDGVRAIAYSQPGELRLHSRNLNDITEQYPELARLNRALSSHGAVLDGEIVAFDEHGRPSFQTLQRRMHVTAKAQAGRLARTAPVTYILFDLLWLDGHSLMALAYSERRERLALLDLNGERWQTPEHVVGHGRELLRASVEQHLEGLVAKRLDSAYTPGRRSGAWIKVKNVTREQFVIGGWLPGAGRRRRRIGALLVGSKEGRALRYAGRVGTGFTEQELDRLERVLAPLEQERSPFAPGPNQPPRGAVFTKPRLSAEVEFRERTNSGSLRAPSYKGLVADAPAEDRTRGAQGSADGGAAGDLELIERKGERARAVIDGRELSLSNLDKVLYPEVGFTKLAVIDYYAAIAALLVAHLQDRALTVTRWPDGVEGQSFFQKQAPAHRPDWVRTVTVPSGRKPIDYVLADDRPTLVWLANLAALELHAPLARAASFERPTVLVFDLDPGAPAGILECCRVALQLSGTFENLGLQSFAKTSGSKGLQVYVPLNGERVTFDDTKRFARTVAELLERAEPELVVSSMTKSKRTGKVLIDWSQNDRRKTTVSAYSLRAVARPCVSTPLEWQEVRSALDSGQRAGLAFEAGEVLRRLDRHGDLFAPVLSLQQELPAL